MYKVRPVFHAGVEFVQISSLPPIQAELIGNMIPTKNLMEIHCGEILLKDCLKYDVYEQWYQLMRTQHYDRYLESQL